MKADQSREDKLLTRKARHITVRKESTRQTLGGKEPPSVPSQILTMNIPTEILLVLFPFYLPSIHQSAKTSAMSTGL